MRRSFVEARGVRFHVTEAGPADGRPVLALHGWPQHHWAYNALLADPPPGLRIIAPDLPGYGWSGPAPHKWAKEDVASDVLALMDALGLDRVLLVAHDWGAYIAWLMVLRAPKREQTQKSPDSPINGCFCVCSAQKRHAYICRARLWTVKARR
ncbi:MAG: hypothetical protein QOD39_5150 [Mycobacterium sp.]|nr:hypothetical protein [Mycobacterium sp.]